jgi:hypothetical protein
MEASKILGCSSKCTILRKEGCLLVFKIFMSLEVNEKKATSLPATKKERIRSIKITKMSIVVAAGVIAKSVSRKFPGSKTE